MSDHPPRHGPNHSSEDWTAGAPAFVCTAPLPNAASRVPRKALKLPLVRHLTPFSMPEQEPRDGEASVMPQMHQAPLPALQTLTAAQPSPKLRWQLLDLLFCYALAARLYNGDHQAMAEVTCPMPGSALCDCHMDNTGCSGIRLSLMALHVFAVTLRLPRFDHPKDEFLWSWVCREREGWCGTGAG